MSRRRWQTVTWLAGLGLVVGCTNLSEHAWLQRFRNRNAMDACCPEMPICGDGAMIVGEGGPVLPPSPGVMETPLGTPTPVTPPPTNGQRLVPQPQPQPQPQPTPFNPAHTRQQ